jgi:predicted porin
MMLSKTFFRLAAFETNPFQKGFNMQKKLIAIAVAALASGVAFAQTNVTIYGAVDVGYTHFSGGMIDYDLPTPKRMHAINSGQAVRNKIGFTGVEDLGNGNKALFVLESGFFVDTGEDNGSIFQEQAFLGLTGNWGTAIAGRLIAPRYGFLSALDPFGDGTVGRFGNVYSDTTASNVDRVNNAVAYVSPTFSGFNVTAAYATHAAGLISGDSQEGIGNDADLRTYTVLPRYTNGPVDVGFAWQRVGVKDEDVKVNQWTLGGSYDFGALKLSAAYDDYKLKEGGYTAERLKSWLIGISAPFGKNVVKASYNQSKLKDVGMSRQWAVGYDYNLSKRTAFYAAYSHITNKSEGGYYLRTSRVGDASNRHYDVLGYRRGLQFGLKHTF